MTIIDKFEILELSSDGVDLVLWVSSEDSSGGVIGFWVSLLSCLSEELELLLFGVGSNLSFRYI